MADDMEQRLVALINNSTERLIDRIGGVEAWIASAERRLTSIDMRLGAIEGRIGSLEARVAALERKP